LSNRFTRQQLEYGLQKSMTSKVLDKKFKVLFGGLGHFPSAFLLTKDALKDDETIDLVECTPESIDLSITDADVVIPFMVPISRRTLLLAPRLKMIMQYGVGVEGVDIESASQMNIWVCNIQSRDCSNDKSSAEHAIYLALSVCRDQKAMQESIISGKLGCPTGQSLYGSNALIYGFGGIGRQLAKRLSNFDMQIAAVTRTLPLPNESYQSEQYLTELSSIDQFPRLAAVADIVFICCSQNSSNMGLVDKAFISQLKQSCVIVNVARVYKTAFELHLSV
jgi:lactate dehydrogenase-like 2-hydroxyacid dehydrogenase